MYDAFFCVFAFSFSSYWTSNSNNSHSFLNNSWVSTTMMSMIIIMMMVIAANLRSGQNKVFAISLRFVSPQTMDRWIRNLTIENLFELYTIQNQFALYSYLHPARFFHLKYVNDTLEIFYVGEIFKSLFSIKYIFYSPWWMMECNVSSLCIRQSHCAECEVKNEWLREIESAFERDGAQRHENAILNFTFQMNK